MYGETSDYNEAMCIMTRKKATVPLLIAFKMERRLAFKKQLNYNKFIILY
jgi:hypothetical protein